MSWAEGYGLLRLLSEEQVGHPAREYEREREAEQIQRMRAGLPAFSE
jgi:hypothetical protein